MSAVAKLRSATPATAAALIAWARLNRADAPPAGDITERETLREVLLMVLEGHLERLRENPPQRDLVWDPKDCCYIPEGEAFDPTRDTTARQLATLIGYLEDLDELEDDGEAEDPDDDAPQLSQADQVSETGDALPADQAADA